MKRTNLAQNLDKKSDDMTADDSLLMLDQLAYDSISMTAADMTACQ